jgi:hypothetical protein
MDLLAVITNREPVFSTVIKANFPDDYNKNQRHPDADVACQP